MPSVDWNHRFIQQAVWTQNLRRYLYSRVGLEQLNHIIEIGCGTGAVLSDFVDWKDKFIYGLDISENFVRIIQRRNMNVCLTIGDANFLPFKENSFDVILCHYFLLWMHDPILILREMKRIARRESSILVLAEPDYSGRLDYPDELKPLGHAQITSLKNQGADPFIGRRLGNLFHSAGISLVEMGILGGQWTPHQLNEAEAEEWQILLHDLQFLPEQEKNLLTKQLELSHFQDIHRLAIRTGERVLFIPTFYAWGMVNK
jgi:SAM-dependent methyltransferase